ncbi:chemotaxis protein MotC [Methylorubrum salsuginis]|uniref:Chemotaxis protein MotC n=2 Tax=Methylorubrum salsuginis TaxID=414703 RepID=A0A1I4GZZ3_9HYPH|nr:chemotaxis protein MotC [Methylorubrum salsuginis]
MIPSASARPRPLPGRTRSSLKRIGGMGLTLLLALGLPAVAADHGEGHGAAPAADSHAAPADDHGGHGGHGAPAKPIEPLPVTPHGLPVELVRTLQLLQDRIARGSTQAHLAQRQLLVHIEQKLTELDPETWVAPENVRAVVTFALAGGGPGVLRRMIATGKVPEAEAPLAQGALDYLQGREKEARAKLAGIDARTMPAGLAGQLALTQSALLVREAPVRSLELLDLARLLSPGTLVEEGALRRQIFVVAQGGDAARFEALSIQYLRRFRRSVYAGNFRQRFAGALTRLDFDSDRTRTLSLERMLDEIEPESRRDLYLLVARAGLEQGRRETALFAAERAAGLAAPDTRAAAQARLYRGAALIVADGRFEEGYEALRSLDRAAFVEGDADLLDAALSAAGQIRGPLPSPAPAAPSAADATARRAVPDAPAIGRAREALARAERALDP